MKRLNRKRLKELGITIIYLFGSAAKGTQGPLSDIDIGLVFKDPSVLEDTRAIYGEIYDELAKLYPSSRLDIVFLQKSPLPLQYYAFKEGKIIYEENPVSTAGYEEMITRLYLDFTPVQRYFDEIASKRYG